MFIIVSFQKNSLKEKKLILRIWDFAKGYFDFYFFYIFCSTIFIFKEIFVFIDLKYPLSSLKKVKI